MIRNECFAIDAFAVEVDAARGFEDVPHAGIHVAVEWRIAIKRSSLTFSLTPIPIPLFGQKKNISFTTTNSITPMTATSITH